MKLTKEQSKKNLATDNSAIFGSVMLGALIPCVLVWVHFAGNVEQSEPIAEWMGNIFGRQSLHQEWSFANLVLLMASSVMGCGSASFIIAFVLKRKILEAYGESVEMKVLEVGSARMGAFAAFFNLPGYAVLTFFPREPISIFRILLLFTVTGASCGLWIGWQTYRVYHPDLGVWPRFSLRTLMTLVFGWGILLALFSPAPWLPGQTPLISTQ